MSSTDPDPTERSRPIRVLVGKPGLDGHDRGAKVVSRALRDAGMEVIYTGIRESTQGIVKTAIQEDVDVIGLSILGGSHREVVAEVFDLLKEYGMTDVIVLVGGVIPDEARDDLYELGVDRIFDPGSDIDGIVEWIEEEVDRP